MAKKNGNGNGHAEDENEVEDMDAAEEVELPKLSKEEKQALFRAYDAAHESVKAAEEATAKAERVRSEKVKEIIQKCGNGPFQWKGAKLTGSKRGERYYFRGPGAPEIEAIG